MLYFFVWVQVPLFTPKLFFFSYSYDFLCKGQGIFHATTGSDIPVGYKIVIQNGSANKLVFKSGEAGCLFTLKKTSPAEDKRCCANCRKMTAS